MNSVLQVCRHPEMTVTPQHIVFPEVYRGCSSDQQDHLIRDLTAMFKTQGIRIGVKEKVRENQDDRKNKRIRFRCRNTKCKFRFQVNYDEDALLWYIPQGTGNFRHSSEDCQYKMKMRQMRDLGMATATTCMPTQSIVTPPVASKPLAKRVSPVTVMNSPPTAPSTTTTQQQLHVVPGAAVAHPKPLMAPALHHLTTHAPSPAASVIPSYWAAAPAPSPMFLHHPVAAPAAYNPLTPAIAIMHQQQQQLAAQVAELQRLAAVEEHRQREKLQRQQQEEANRKRQQQDEEQKKKQLSESTKDKPVGGTKPKKNLEAEALAGLMNLQQKSDS